jgi:hypothetical protein
MHKKNANGRHSTALKGLDMPDTNIRRTQLATVCVSCSTEGFDQTASEDWHKLDSGYRP